MLPDLNAARRNALLVRITAIFWIVAKLISWKLWLADRIFPLVPLLHFFAAPEAVHLGFYIISLLGLLLLLIFPSNTKLQSVIVIIELLTCSLDQNRWQPWEYQYVFVLLIFIINRKNAINATSVFRFMLSAIYIYSGISKLNTDFSLYIGHKVLIHSGTLASISSFVIFHHGIYLIGLTEFILGVGLLFKLTIKPAAYLLIAMHLFILYILGPLGTNCDMIIWPWNIAMIVYLFVLVFRNPSNTIAFQSLWTRWNKLIVILFGFMPLFNLFGYWDYYLSSSLYSCKPLIMYVTVPEKAADKVLLHYAANTTGDSVIVNITHWSYEEMNVPVYPQLRVYKDIRLQLMKTYPGIGDDFFTVTVNGTSKTSLK